MIVVSDNSPLQNLILIDCVECLRQIYGKVVTTPEVIQELGQEGTPEKVRQWASALPGWLVVEAAKDIQFLDKLDVGEASAISLACERGADLVLIDERAGTQVAKENGVQAIGTLGILVEGGIAGYLAFEPALQRLLDETPFYASPSLIESVRKIYLKQAGSSREARG